MNLDELLPRERTPKHYLEVVDDPRLDQEGLRELAGSDFVFVRCAVAACPRSDAGTLAAVPLDGLDKWTRNSLLRELARHPNAGRALLLDVLRRTRALLEQLDHRPYSAVLELAARPELTGAEIRELIEMPGASRRVRSAARRIREDMAAAAGAVCGSGDRVAAGGSAGAGHRPDGGTRGGGAGSAVAAAGPGRAASAGDRGRG